MAVVPVLACSCPLQGPVPPPLLACLGRDDRVWGPFRHASAPAEAATLACCHLRLAISLGGCSS
jgi:hypothetical protein